MDYINMDKRFQLSKILTWNFIFLLLFATPTVPKADAFGFDSANSCNTNGNGKLSRRGRAQMLAAIPCDLTRQAYCHLPGTAYPWHAVRRFVHENHGLMKRMYGDVRHISVLRDEILNNEIDVDDVELAAERYSKAGQRRTAKFMHNREDFVALKSNDVLMEPHFRPVSSTAATATTTTSSSSTVSSTAAAKPNSAVGGSSNRRRIDSSIANIRNHYGNASGTNRRRITGISRWEPNRPPPPTRPQRRKTTVAGITDEEREKGEETAAVSEDDDNLESNSVYEVPTPPETDLSIGDNIQIIESPQLGYGNGSETATISTTLKVVTVPDTKTAPAPTSLQKRPQLQPIRQRPAQQQQQQQQQQPHKANSTISKESFNLKTNEPSNESERIPTTTITTTPATSTAVKGGNNKHAGATGMDNNADNKDSETGAAASETNKKSSQTDHSNKNNHNNVPTELTSTTITTSNSTRTSATPTATAPAAASTSLSSSPSPEAAVSASAAATTMESSIDLLSEEKLQRPPAAMSASASATATATVTASAGAPPATAPTKPVLRDGQLYQDTLKPEVKPNTNARGINACPVKEEVVAPFWANNTRGEVLALLNLYPFEQYVHWEKCTHEHRQMYCRDGCRCEQQYRLHRLLAYDPHNECRGIFSDWFRFPSCCICKCYGMPMEFRATSRSPRSERGDLEEFSELEPELNALPNAQRHPIDIAEETVRKAIYEHATEDWYRPKEEFDFYEG